MFVKLAGTVVCLYSKLLLLIMFGLVCFRADELVKRVFTLEFSPRNHSFRVLKYDMINSVGRHDLDMGSSESKSELEMA
jgi:hypothetical protein